MRRRIASILSLSVTLAGTGCAYQAKIIQHRHWELNDTIRATHREQLLLNIVRLRYDDTPYFLQVSSVTTSFSAQGSFGVSGQIPEGGPNVLGLSGGVAYSESPVVTWSLPDSREYFGRLLAPINSRRWRNRALTRPASFEWASRR